MPQRDQAYRQFVSGSSPRLLRLSYLLVGDHAHAKDLLQDVLEKIYMKWPSIGEPEAYARRSLANAATNRWRARSRRPEVPLSGQHDVLVAGPEPSDRERLLAALATLGQGQRVTVVLRYFEDLSVDQVADLLRCSPGTVKSQTARAIPRLRELLSITEQTC